MLVDAHGAVNSSAFRRYMPGLPKFARERSIGPMMGSGAATVSLSCQSLFRASIGSLEPPSTAAVTAPIEMPATAAGLKPGRALIERLENSVLIGSQRTSSLKHDRGVELPILNCHGGPSESVNQATLGPPQTISPLPRLGKLICTRQATAEHATAIPAPNRPDGH